MCESNMHGERIKIKKTVVTFVKEEAPWNSALF
jgi:hypothetical protein